MHDKYLSNFIYVVYFYFLDYVGFIKKIMKLMQHEYPMIAKIEIEMTQEMEMDCLPIRPSKLFFQHCLNQKIIFL